jgi:hypothetical protein
VGAAGVEYAQAVGAVVHAVQAPEEVDLVAHAVGHIEHEVKRQVGDGDLAPEGQVVGRGAGGQHAVLEQQARAGGGDQGVHKEVLEAGNAHQRQVVQGVVDDFTGLEVVGLLGPDVLHGRAHYVIRRQEIQEDFVGIKTEMLNGQDASGHCPKQECPTDQTLQHK